ncbi:MAG: acetyl-CoA carboxylase biotin carboxyl carrier protein [Bacteroidota bacterium]
MDINEIQDLIKFVAKSGVNEVEIERKDFKITIKSEGANGKKKKGEELTQMQQIPMNIQPIQPIAVPQQQVIQAPQPAAAPAPAPAAAPAPPAEDKGADESKYITVKSPMIGTFYRSPGPDKDTFVNVGDSVSPGKVVCIIEAMKLFNEIESEISGKIVKVLADDASPVEYDQPLFLVDPS